MYKMHCMIILTVYVNRNAKAARSQKDSQAERQCCVRRRRRADAVACDHRWCTEQAQREAVDDNQQQHQLDRCCCR